MHVGRQNVTADVYADTVYSEQYTIETAVAHPYYDENNNLNDIGYIKTSRDIRYRYRIKLNQVFLILNQNLF